MAETNQMKVTRNLTIGFGDGTRSYTVVNDSGAITWTNGGYDVVRARDSAGDFTGPPRAGQANPSTIEIDAAMFGAGANASEVALTDFAHLSGLFSSTWTTTESGSDAVVKPFNVTITIAAAGGVAGATYVYNDCVVRPGSSVTGARDGIRVKASLESPQAYATVATVAP
jgi:hypothetical protein